MNSRVLLIGLCCSYAMFLFAMDVDTNTINIPCINGGFVSINSDRLRIFPHLRNIESWPESEKKYLETTTFDSLLQEPRCSKEKFYTFGFSNDGVFFHDAGKMIKLNFLLSRGASRTSKILSASSLINGYILQQGCAQSKEVSAGAGRYVTSIHHGNDNYVATAFGGLYKNRIQNNKLETETLSEPIDYQSLLTEATIGDLQELPTLDAYWMKLEKTIEDAFARIQYRALAANGDYLAAGTYDHVDIFTNNKKIRTWNFQSVSPITSIYITPQGFLGLIKQEGTNSILSCYKDVISSHKHLNGGVFSPMRADYYQISFDFLNKNDAEHIYTCTIKDDPFRKGIEVSDSKQEIIKKDSVFSGFRDSVHMLIPYLHKDKPSEQFKKDFEKKETVMIAAGLLVAAYLLRPIIAKFDINFKPEPYLQNIVMRTHLLPYKLSGAMQARVYANGNICLSGRDTARIIENDSYEKNPELYNISDDVLQKAAEQNDTNVIDGALENNIKQFNVSTNVLASENSICLTLPSAMDNIVKKYTVFTDAIRLRGKHRQDKEYNVIAYGKNNNGCDMDFLQEKQVVDTKETKVVQQQLVFQGREIPLPVGIQCEPNIEYISEPKYDMKGKLYGRVDEPSLRVKKSWLLDYILPRTVVFPRDNDFRNARIRRPSYFNLIKPWVIVPGIYTWIKSKFSTQHQTNSAANSKV